MKVLKKKFQKIRIKRPVKIAPDEDTLKYKPTTILKLTKIKIKPKLGRWCEYYKGRIPYPMECQVNRETPTSSYFKNGKEIVTKRTPVCVNCKRSVEWRAWKRGDWDKIIAAISKGEDLKDMDAPIKEIK